MSEILREILVDLLVILLIFAHFHDWITLKLEKAFLQKKSRPRFKRNRFQ